MNKKLFITLCLFLYNIGLFTADTNQRPVPTCWSRCFGPSIKIHTYDSAADQEQARKQAFRKQAAAQEVHKPKSFLAYCNYTQKTQKKAAKKGALYQIYADKTLKDYYGFDIVNSGLKFKTMIDLSNIDPTIDSEISQSFNTSSIVLRTPENTKRVEDEEDEEEKKDL